ncbi:DUF3515 domain-containing protein [Kitasatospora sp. NBC_01250]|uniref:DUF3515 family protein n=1 Tax=Kitasatospora sp. NBC_01250 TaxID=2903571 RepID=UPI002E371301|nr:DUF3515 family protein [Kitasatospora sp. NBC_01250]
MPPNPTQLLKRLPAPLRWLLPPVVLTAVVALVVASGGAPGWQPPTAAPTPDARVAAACRSLAAALPDQLLGHPREAAGSSPYVAVWHSSPRTVLRCGVPRPAALDGSHDLGPETHGVQWFVEHDGHGGYRFTTSQLSLYVEVAVPAGAYPNAPDPLVDLSGPIAATVPGLDGRVGEASQGS